MNNEEIRKLLDEVAAGRLDVEAALEMINSTAGIDDLSYACLDTDRDRRTGIPEVIFAPGKTDEQLKGLVERFLSNENRVIVTRANESQADILIKTFPDLYHNPIAGVLRYPEKDNLPHPLIGVVTAGTSDIPVAEEASETLAHLGHPVDKFFDIGVAGIHRVLNVLDRLRSTRVLIVIAGMEGALPSVIGGLVECPVIAVPTSIGYGASFGGISALLGMLNSCAAGIGVVNIDNGFGAAALAHRIAVCGERKEKGNER